MIYVASLFEEVLNDILWALINSSIKVIQQLSEIYYHDVDSSVMVFIIGWYQLTTYYPM